MSTSRMMSRTASRVSSPILMSPQFQTTTRRHFPRHHLTYSPSHTCQQLRPQSTISSASLPKIAQSSIWHSIVPKFLRRPRDTKSTPSTKSGTPSSLSKEWNPATFYILIFLLIGSQAIHLLVLRKDFETHSRRADAKLQLLREVISKLQNGENVDVEKILGTGDEVKEREWEEVLRQIQEEDSLWQESSSENVGQSSANSDQELNHQQPQIRSADVPRLPSLDSPKDTTTRMSRFY